MFGILRYIVDALGGEWNRLTFCGFEAQVGVAASYSERPLEIERRNSREQKTSFLNELMPYISELYT